MPDVKPEPYHGSVSHAANYRSAAASNYPLTSGGMAGPSATSSRVYEMMSPSGILGGGYSMEAMQPNLMHPQSSYVSRFESGYGPYLASGGGGGGAASMYSPLAAMTPKGLIGGPSILPNRYRGPLPYALVPAPSFPFG